MGLNTAARLKGAGIAVKKGDIIRAPLSVMHLVRTGPTKHPRANLPPDPDLVEHIKKHGIPTDERRFKAREDGDRLEVINGARRTVAGLVAEKWLRKHQPRQPPLEWDRADPSDPGQLYAETEIVACSDLELVLERLDANTARGLPDSKSVLAATVAQIVKLNKGEPDDLLMARIVERMPRGVTGAVVHALLRWDNLGVDLQTRLDDPAVPIGLLVPVMNTRAEDRDTRLTTLLRDGVRSAKGATRKANAAKDARDPWARRMSPRQILSVAEKLSAAGSPGSGALDGGKKVHDAAWMVAAGMWLAANKDPHGVLDLLPKPIADLIREARAAKPARKERAR